MVLPLVVAVGVIGVRQIGWLQQPELWAFDQLMKLQPKEGGDDRIFMIEITDADIESQPPDERTASTSLSDSALSKILDKLNSFGKDGPRTIGLDIYREPLTIYPGDREDTRQSKRNLVNHYRTNQKLITACKVPDPDAPDPEERDPAGKAPIQWRKDLTNNQSTLEQIPFDRQSFTDFVEDRDGIIRRQLLEMTPNTNFACRTPYAFSLQIAAHYLKKKPEQLVQELYPWIQPHFGGYQGTDAGGRQILLKYRRNGNSLEDRPHMLTFSNLSNLTKDLVRDRIVLIGITAANKKDDWTTPYSRRRQDTRGIILQAQMISQILSTVEGGQGAGTERRSLLWALPSWADWLWILAYAGIGGLIGWCFSSRRLALLVLGLSIGALLIICYLVFSTIWLPLIPSALAMVIAGLSVAYTTRKDH